MVSMDAKFKVRVPRTSHSGIIMTYFTVMTQTANIEGFKQSETSTKDTSSVGKTSKKKQEETTTKTKEQMCC